MTPASPQRVRVLILTSEEIVAALLGLLVESDRFEPIFARADESPEDAVARARPPLILLLDGMLEAARSDIFFARAARARARVALLAPPPVAVARSTGGCEMSVDVEAHSRSRGVPYLPLPADRETMARCLERLAEGLA